MRSNLVITSLLVVLVSVLSSATFTSRVKLPNTCERLIARVLVCSLPDHGSLQKTVEFLTARPNQYRVLYIFDSSLDCDCKWRDFANTVKGLPALQVSGAFPCSQSDLLALRCGVNGGNGNPNNNAEGRTDRKDDKHKAGTDTGHENVTNQKPLHVQILSAHHSPNNKTVHASVNKLLQLKKFLLQIVDLRTEMSKVLSTNDQLFLLDIFHNHIGDLQIKEIKDGWHTFFLKHSNHNNTEATSSHNPGETTLTSTQQKLIIFGSIVLVIIIGVIAMLCAKMTAEKKELVHGIQVTGDLDLGQCHDTDNDIPTWKIFLRKLQFNCRRKAMANAEVDKHATVVYKRLPTSVPTEEIVREFSKGTRVEQRQGVYENVKTTRTVTFDMSPSTPQRSRFTVDTDGNIIETLEKIESSPYSKYNPGSSSVYENVKRQQRKHYSNYEDETKKKETPIYDDVVGTKPKLFADQTIDSSTVLTVTTNDDVPHESKPHRFVSTDSMSDRMTESMADFEEIPSSSRRRSSIKPEDIKVTVVAKSTNNNGTSVQLERPSLDKRTRIPADLSMDSISSEDVPRRRSNSGERRRSSSSSPVKSLIDRYEKDDPSILKGISTDSDAEIQKKAYAQLATETYRKEKKRLTFANGDDATQNGDRSTKELLTTALLKQRRLSLGVESDEESSD